jgi:hypothetical protein
MAADTTTALLGLLLQGTGNDNNAWGANLNTSVIQFLEDAIAGQATITSVGGTYTLNAVEARASTLLLSNTLTSNLTIVVPDTAKNYRIVNFNAVNGFFTLLKCATAATTVSVPRSKSTEIVVTGGAPYRSDRCEIGRYVYDASRVKGDSVECDGTAYKRATLPDLFNEIGTTYGFNDATDFKVPNAYDTGRFLRSRTAAVAVGTSQANQNGAHTHIASASAVTGTTDNPGNHTHANTLTDLGHVHGIKVGSTGGGVDHVTQGDFGASSTAAGGPTGPVQTATTGISINNAGAGAHTHNVTGTAAAQIIASSGGTEARPESLVGILCIKY